MHHLGKSPWAVTFLRSTVTRTPQFKAPCRLHHRASTVTALRNPASVSSSAQNLPALRRGMADERPRRPSPSIPSHEAPEGRPHPNDVDVFASVTYLLARDSLDLRDVELKMNDRDVLLNIKIDNDHTRVLHLQHVREDTLAEAKIAADEFLDQHKPLGGPQNTVYHRFDKIYKEMEYNIPSVLADVEDFQEKMTEVGDSESIYPKVYLGVEASKDQGFDPVAELIYASNDFLDRVKEIQSKSKPYKNETCPTKTASITSRQGGDSAHKHLANYIEEQALGRGFFFNCDDTGRSFRPRAPR
ncbi:unnamed protein product [Clonostachys rosea]|uniref:Uncharacterized protein n=1 Tax=Bionectria ochroleuca TaxID=29856 RepID=A0ABY6UIK2_BIOOC|nr:unnamed protein product [Clonostachys rosea]